jgi:type VII secretion-associated serine protease mycosin
VTTLLAKPLAGVLSLLLGVLTGLPAAGGVRDQQWHLDFLHIDQAHTISTGKGVTVGVIDTGVDAAHPDLAGPNLLPGADFSFEKRPDAWADQDGHGTAMAGLIAAHGQSEGIAPDATILPARTSVSIAVSEFATADAVRWAVDHGATVLCIASAGPNPDQGLKSAIDYAIAHDAVVVAASGNAPDDKGVVYPAGYPGVVGVTGIDQTGNAADFAVASSASVVAAPGVDIMTTRARNVVQSGYGTGSGTSDATAIVAGVAALVRAKFPDMPATEVIHRLTATAQDRGAPGRDDEYGYGIVDPVAALTADIPPLAHPSTVERPSPQAAPNSPSRAAVLGIVAAATGVAIVLLITTGLVIALRRRS